MNTSTIRRGLGLLALVGFGAVLTACASTSQTPPPTSQATDTPAAVISFESLEGPADIGTDGLMASWKAMDDSIVFNLGGSGTAACAPKPESAVLEDGVLKIKLDESSTDRACTMDYRLYGFKVTGDGIPDSVEIVTTSFADNTEELPQAK